MSLDLGLISATDVIAKLHTRELTSVDLVTHLLDRIQQRDQGENGLHSVLALADDALEQARKADASEPVGPLHGVPVLIKDNIEAIGLPGTAGSLALANRTVTRDAELVRRLRDAGAIILGSTNLSEWANIRASSSTSGWSAVGGLTGNPWSQTRSVGGSSSGSGAAISAGFAPLAIGTETDGSIVCPASMTGCVGIKPTVGSVSRDGVIPISSSMDSPGPMARTVLDAALLLEAISDISGAVAAASEQQHLTVGVVREWLTQHEDTDAVFESAVAKLREAGVTVKEVSMKPRTDESQADEGTVLFHELLEDLDEYLRNRPGDGVKSLSDVVAFNKAHADEELQHFGQDYFEIALKSGGRNQKYRSARQRNLNWAITKTLNPAFESVDVLISPAYGPAHLSDLVNGDRFIGGGLSGASAIAGWPIGSLPMGFVHGLPVGMGVTARENDEVTLVRAMATIERILGLGILVPTFAQHVELPNSEDAVAAHALKAHNHG